MDKQIELEKAESTPTANTQTKQRAESVEFHQLNNHTNNNSKKSSKIKIAVLAIILIIIAIVFSVIFSIINMNKNTIISGVTINNIDVSNMTKNEAISALNNLINAKIESKLEFSYAPNTEEAAKTENESVYETTLDFKSLDIQYDINSAVDEAYNFGRIGNIVENNYKILGALISNKNFDIKITLDEQSLDKAISDISANLPNKLIENSYYMEDDNLIITRGQSGNIVNDETFKNMFYSKLNNISSSENCIEVPTKNVDPSEINVSAIHSEVYKEPKNAYYEENPFKVYAESKGIDFDIEKAKQLILENPDEKEYTISLKYTDPKITIKDLDIDVFPDLLAKFSTRYDGTNKERTTNLKLAASKINGTILAPGEEFSYNAVVGERTIAAGYKEAAIYQNGQVVDGLGGGICQISSTLYNAVVFANLEVTQRYNHQFVTSYVEAGRDATVVYGVKDFKFVNNRTYPIKLVFSVDSGIAKVQIYGIKEKIEYDVSFDIDTVSRIPYTVKYVKDSSLKEGTEKVTQKGTNGIIVNAYKVVKQNGKVISKTLLSKDTYNAMQRIILTGTAVDKKDENTTKEQNDTTNKNENTNNNTSTQENNSSNEVNSNTTSSSNENTNENNAPIDE